MCDPRMITARGKSPRHFDVLGRSRIFFLSADNPESILGYGFKDIVVDEAARIPKDIVEYYILPTISQTQGGMLAISTPKGRGWFWEYDQLGLDPDEARYESFHFESRDNPYFPAEEWEFWKEKMPEIVFRQEYMAEFIEDSAGVFRGIDNCLHPGELEKPGDRVILGVDLAKHRDFTVLIGLNADTGGMCHFDRFNKIDWPFQKARITATANRLNANVQIDSTGVGDAIYDDLRRAGLNIKGIKLTNDSKQKLIEGLMLAIEQRHTNWPEKYRILTDELRRYEYYVTPHGRIVYNAPSGYHDDCVIAIALAVGGIAKSINPHISVAGGKNKKDEKTIDPYKIDDKVEQMRFNNPALWS